jgi:hypothetical protein
MRLASPVPVPLEVRNLPIDGRAAEMGSFVSSTEANLLISKPSPEIGRFRTDAPARACKPASIRRHP